MGDRIRINRATGRFCSHTLSHSRPVMYTASEDHSALRERLISAIAEVLAEGGDPRLAKSRSRP